MDRRARTGCLTCRTRRIKCDEAKPSCLRCHNANFLCGGYEAPRRKPKTKPVKPVSTTASPHSTQHLPTRCTELSVRHVGWRQDQLPLYHHFVTTSALRLFRRDHVDFWRDQVAQMSYGVDVVYEALLAVGAVHRASLLSYSEGSPKDASACKILGMHAYGRALRLLPKYLQYENVTELRIVLAVLPLLTYFEV
jgi:Fungal Zn(2)-Cys(6) binuclear cluster domain